MPLLISPDQAPPGADRHFDVADKLTHLPPGWLCTGRHLDVPRTALYSAPELLAGGAPTVQADIYALGILLFQLVACDFRTPLAPGWEERVGDKLLQSDIAAAAAGDPARRLGDAGDFARRLRHLDQRRAEAKREAAALEELTLARNALERARARRAPIMALIVALAVGLSASSWMYLRAERAQTRAEASATQERAVTRFLTDDLLSSANPLLAGNPDIKVKDVLGTASAKLDRNFPNGGLDRAAIEAALGQTYAGQNQRNVFLPYTSSVLQNEVNANIDPRVWELDSMPASSSLTLSFEAGATYRGCCCP